MALDAETKDIVSQFELTDDDVNNGVQEFLRQMVEGLEKQGTSVSQIPTYVTAVPNGTEKGLYLAVDLGGTNLRVCSVQLNGDTTFNLTYSKAPIPKELMTAKTSEELFTFIAEQIEQFLQKHHNDHFEAIVKKQESKKSASDEQIFQLGFTFSFPVNQSGINKGNLLRWTKGFDIADTVGKDVCALLQEAIDKLKLPVKVAALVNDTVGTLMARSYTSPGKNGSILGAIFGTGTNGAYIEKLENIKKPMDGDYDKSTGEMVVNTEWGSFDNQLNVLPTTPWDTKLDKESVNPGIQMFEKRVSGMFLGEILRLALVDMVNKESSTFFKAKEATIPQSSDLFKQWGVDSAIMSVAAQDTSSDLATLRQALEEQFFIPSPSLESAQAVQAIAAAIGRRAARLSAIAVAAIVLQTGKLTHPAWQGEEIDVGVDGSLVEYYPRFRDMITEAMGVVKEIGPEGAARVRIGIAKDGSGVGAALIALVAAGMETKKPIDQVGATG